MSGTIGGRGGESFTEYGRIRQSPYWIAAMNWDKRAYTVAALCSIHVFMALFLVYLPPLGLNLTNLTMTRCFFALNPVLAYLLYRKTSPIAGIALQLFHTMSFISVTCLSCRASHAMITLYFIQDPYNMAVPAIYSTAILKLVYHYMPNFLDAALLCAITVLMIKGHGKRAMPKGEPLEA
jgi:hypothetical protein